MTDCLLLECGVGVRGGVLLVVSEELLEGPSAWRSQGDLWVYHGVYLVEVGDSCPFLGMTTLALLWPRGIVYRLGG